MKAIIFGADGQDGYYLTSLLKEQGYEIIGIARHDQPPIAKLSDFQSVAGLIRDHQPDYIFHLAAESSTRHEAMFENHATIATGTLNILEAVKTSSPLTKVFLSGSGLQFRNENKPIRETDPFEARDAYSVSRIQSVYAARYFRSLGIQTYIGYFFNHDSPLRTERHMTKKIAEAVKRIAAGSHEKLEIGDIDAIKEYTFAGDVVKGIWTLVNQDTITESNISSGRGYSILEWLEQCFTLRKLEWKDHVVSIPGFIQTYQQLVSDPARIFSLGWKPEVSFEELAKLMMKL